MTTKKDKIRCTLTMDVDTYRQVQRLQGQYLQETGTCTFNDMAVFILQEGLRHPDHVIRAIKIMAK